MLIGYHASHEQFAPSALLELVQRAEAAGFGAAMCSDHIHTWSVRQGESGFAWSWLGAALQATNLSFGVVNAPGGRYHPAVIAQAAATLTEMFPGRFWIAPGSGQALNEHITGERWPTKPERNQRLLESVEVMRALWRGERVDFEGTIRVENARVWSLPEEPPPVIAAAVTPETAEWVAGWADGFITVSRPPEKLKEVAQAFRRGGGEGKPMYLQAKHAYARTDDEALEGAYDQWRTNMFGSAVLTELRTTEQFDLAARRVRREDAKDKVRVSADPDKHVAWLQEDRELGFERVYVHNVCRNQEEFIDAFGERVLPAFRK